MAQISFENMSVPAQGGNFAEGPAYFSLLNDGDEAVVRFAYNNVGEFDVFSYHDVPLISRQGKEYHAKINCINDPRDMSASCPFCNSGMKPAQKFFVKMIQYTKDANGVVSVKPVIWERSTQYAIMLKGYLDNYGPLTEIICKVVRHGKRGDQQTRYEIIPNLSPMMYPADVYVKDFSGFADYKILGNMVQDRSASDMSEFLTTGAFPQRQRQQDNGNDTVAFDFATAQQPAYNQQFGQPQQFTAPAQQFTAPAQPVSNPAAGARGPLPWENNNNGVNRPVRTF